MVDKDNIIRMKGQSYPWAEWKSRRQPLWKPHHSVKCQHN